MKLEFITKPLRQLQTWVRRYKARKIYKIAEKIARVGTTKTTKLYLDEAIKNLCIASREFKNPSA